MMKKPYTPLDILNFKMGFKLSDSPDFRRMGALYEGRIEMFLGVVFLGRETTLKLVKEEDVNTLSKVFAQGFLSPKGEFHWIDIGQHEEMSGRCTGFSEVDDAFNAGWIKFSFGLPYNHFGENLLSKKCDRSKVTKNQLEWMRQHYRDLMEDDSAVDNLLARFEV